MAVLALFGAAVWQAVPREDEPLGHAGLEFGRMTPAATWRTPWLKVGGALVTVSTGSAASKAGIKSGEVVAEIDGVSINSARQASDLIRRYKAGDRVELTLFDVPRGDIHSHKVMLHLEARPARERLSVHPPRTLEKRPFKHPPLVANAAWSNRIAKGAYIRPVKMKRLSVARCGGYAPEGWQVVSHARDGGIFHVSSEDRASHAIYKTAYSQTPNAQSFILGFLDQTFGTPHVLTPAQPRPFGFVLQGFGSKVNTGFVVYRIADQRTALWAVAVPVDNSKGKALAGAVAFTLQCEETRGLKPYSRDPALPETAISRSCLAGRCSETDLAATYLSNLHLGYAHNSAGEMFLVDPRRDLWQSGEKGPGFYHHTGGINEKLNSGRAG